MLVNLLRNAFKFAKGTLVVLVVAYDEENGMLLVNVIDGGRGILPAN